MNPLLTTGGKDIAFMQKY